VTEQERLHTASTRNCPSHAVGKAKSVCRCPLLFRNILVRIWLKWV